MARPIVLAVTDHDVDAECDLRELDRMLSAVSHGDWKVHREGFGERAVVVEGVTEEAHGEMIRRTLAEIDPEWAAHLEFLDIDEARAVELIRTS